MSEIVHIESGEYYASKKPVEITTVLGSCVAVCLMNAEMNIGGMNHILMPGRIDMIKYNQPARYAINAMELLINKMMQMGADRFGLCAKVFGGAHIIDAISEVNAVGLKNASSIIEFLKKEEIKILSHDLGGRDTRRIYFHTGTGDVYLKRYSGRIIKNLELLEKVN